MGTLDSRVALALMAKAERVFAQPGQLLAFPVGASSYSSRQLHFFPESPTAEEMRLATTSLQAFSSFVNMVPDGQVWLSAAGRQDLPQVYRQVLTHAQVAALPEDASALEQLRQARALLTVRNDGGAEVDTPVYAAYKKYRDAYVLADQQYNAGKISGELTENSDAKEAWKRQEPLLLAARAQALTDWQVEGHREEVENALGQVANLTPKAPVSSWNDWKLRSDEGIGTVTDLAGGAFWPTYISPANAFDTGWQRMVLTSGEVEGLQASAPKQLKARLGAGQPELELDNLEFEYTTAKLHRPWFDGSVFAARFWRSKGAENLLISTGQDPYDGACPLYASAVVFFRRIRATVKGEPEEVNSKLDAIGHKIDLGVFAVDRPKILVAPRPPIPKQDFNREVPAVDFKKILRQEGRVNPGPAAEFAKTPMAASNFAAKDVINQRAMVRGFMYEPALTPIQWDPAPPSPASSVLETGDDEIFVMALICTIVPPSPNPDMSLNWN